MHQYNQMRFTCSLIKFLGYKIFSKGVQPLLLKVDTIRDFPEIYQFEKMFWNGQILPSIYPKPASHHNVSENKKEQKNALVQESGIQAHEMPFNK